MTFSQLIRIHQNDIQTDLRRAKANTTERRQKNQPKPTVFTDWASL